jgi:pyridoxine 4-dehydrogenase
VQRLLLGGDLPVRRIGYGALRLTGEGFWRRYPDSAHAVRVLRRAVEWGVDLVDTADSYGLGANEELIAEALYPYPDRLVVATKVGQCRPAPGVWIPLGRPEYLRQQAELSLRRLRTERIDLLALHRVDPTVPFADQVGALRDLQVAGKVRHIGLSKVSAVQIDEAVRIADIASVQNPYNVTDRAFEQSLVRCAELGIAFLAWLPVKQGRLAAADSPVAAFATQLGVSPAQVSLAWLLHRSPVTVPIPATTSLAHLRENVAAARISLPAATMTALSALSADSGRASAPR